MFVEQFLPFQVQGCLLSFKLLIAPRALSITAFLFHDSFIEVIPSNINLQPLPVIISILQKISYPHLPVVVKIQLYDVLE